MKTLLVLLLFIPSVCLGLTFKNGQQVGSYKGIGWPTIEKHGLDAGKIGVKVSILNFLDLVNHHINLSLEHLTVKALIVIGENLKVLLEEPRLILIQKREEKIGMHGHFL